MEGKAFPKSSPPLAKSDYLMADKRRAIEVVQTDYQEKSWSTDREYASVMPTDDHMADDELPTF